MAPLSKIVREREREDGKLDGKKEEGEEEKIEKPSGRWGDPRKDRWQWH